MALLNLPKLHDTLRAFASVVSVSVPVLADKATWVIQYDPANPPTKEQIEAVIQAIEAFDPARLQPEPARDIGKEVDDLKAVLVRKAVLTDKDVEVVVAEAALP